MRQIRSNVPAPRRCLDRRVTGTPEHVAATVAMIRDSGRLVAMSPPRQTPEGVTVTVRFLERAQPATQPAAPVRRQRRRWPAVAAAGVGVTTLGVAAYALIQLINAVVALLPVIIGALVLLALAVLLTGGRSRTFSGTFTGRMD